VTAILAVIRWLWDTDPGPHHPPVDIGGGITLPVYATGPVSHAWWAMIVLVLVSGSVLAALIFSYYFLWTASPDIWPASTGWTVPELAWPLTSGLLLLASGGAVALGSRVAEHARVLDRSGPHPAGERRGPIPLDAPVTTTTFPHIGVSIRHHY
jgi:cytochrome c oxidase subunit I+III